MNRPAEIKLGFLGAGGWARQNHFPAIKLIADTFSDRFRVDFAALCEKDTDLALRMQNEYGISRVYSDLERFSEDPEINCLAVVVRPSALPGVMEVLRKRKLPIFSEKPPGLTHKEAVHLAETVIVPNVVGFNRRYFPLNRRFAEIVRGMDGIYFVRAMMTRHERFDSMLDPADPPFVTGTGIHLINLLEYFFGSIRTVETTIVDDTKNGTRGWTAAVTYESGVPGRIDIFPCSGSQGEWVEVHSRHQSAYLRGCQYGPIEPPGEIEIHTGREKQTIPGEASAPHLVAAGFVNEYLDFFEAVAGGGGATASNFANAVNGMRVAEAIENGEGF